MLARPDTDGGLEGISFSAAIAAAAAAAPYLGIPRRP
jgi:hypothetical protein